MKKKFKQKELNEHDRVLINKAFDLHWTEWASMNEDEAETEEGYNMLKRRLVDLYHREEAANGDI